MSSTSHYLRPSPSAVGVLVFYSGFDIGCFDKKEVSNAVKCTSSQMHSLNFFVLVLIDFSIRYWVSPGRCTAGEYVSEEGRKLC